MRSNLSWAWVHHGRITGKKSWLAVRSRINAVLRNPIRLQTGVIWFRQGVKDTGITGMTPPYGSKTRTDEENTYGELKAA